MGWDDSEKRLAEAGEWVRLENDGDSCDFVPITPPEVTETDSKRYGKREVFRVQVACVGADKTSAIVKTLDMGSRAFRSYSVIGKGAEGRDVIQMTRHGAQGDQDTTYRFKTVGQVNDAERLIVEGAWRDWKAIQGEEDATD